VILSLTSRRYRATLKLSAPLVGHSLLALLKAASSLLAVKEKLANLILR
jgi:hypothetical protein